MISLSLSTWLKAREREKHHRFAFSWNERAIIGWDVLLETIKFWGCAWKWATCNLRECVVVTWNFHSFSCRSPHHAAEEDDRLLNYLMITCVDGYAKCVSSSQTIRGASSLTFIQLQLCSITTHTPTHPPYEKRPITIKSQLDWTDAYRPLRMWATCSYDMIRRPARLNTGRDHDKLYPPQNCTTIWQSKIWLRFGRATSTLNVRALPSFRTRWRQSILPAIRALGHGRIRTSNLPPSCKPLELPHGTQTWALHLQ